MSELTRKEVETILLRFGIDLRAAWRDDWRALAANDAAQRQRIADLEQALRLHLAVSPDDPLLLTPVEQQLAELQAKWHYMATCDPDVDMAEECIRLTSKVGEVEREKNTWAELAGSFTQSQHKYLCEMEQLKDQLAASEARVARLEEALKELSVLCTCGGKVVVGKDGSVSCGYDSHNDNCVKAIAHAALSQDGTP